MSDNAGTPGGSSPYPGQQPPTDPGSQPPAYGSQPPAYGSQPPAHGSPPAYGSQPPAYGSQPPAYGSQPPAYGSQPPAYGSQPPAYGSTDPNSYLGPPAYPGGGYGVPPPPNQQSGWSGLAIAAFVASLVPLIGILAAVPLAIVALVKIGKSYQKGKGLAIAAIIISVLWWIGFLGLGAWWNTQQVERNEAGEITAEGIVEFGDIRAGDCVKIPDPGGSEDVNTYEIKGVPCSEPHNAEVAAVTPLPSESYPGFDALESQLVPQCANSAQRYLASAPAIGLRSRPLIPTESLWDDDNGHRAICFITQADYSETTGSLADK